VFGIIFGSAEASSKPLATSFKSFFLNLFTSSCEITPSLIKYFSKLSTESFSSHF